MKSGRKRVSSFMKKFGGFPMQEGDSWNFANFNKSKLFEDHPQMVFAFFSLGFIIEKSATNDSDHDVTVRLN